MVSVVVVEIVVREYVDQHGSSPFRAWLRQLDISVRARIQARILRFETGNLGDHKLLGDGVWEARLPFGPGYRVYFGKSGRTLVLLLLGGDKRSQAKDIERAKAYWANYSKETKHDKTK
jgi:putative addiction module killer protein